MPYLCLYLLYLSYTFVLLCTTVFTVETSVEVNLCKPVSLVEMYRHALRCTPILSVETYVHALPRASVRVLPPASLLVILFACLSVHMHLQEYVCVPRQASVLTVAVPRVCLLFCPTGRENNKRQNIFLCPWRLSMRSLNNRAINNRHYLYLFYYCRLFPNRWHGIIIRDLVAPKIWCLSCINSHRNILGPISGRQTVVSMKVDRNKRICPDFGRNLVYGCNDDHNGLPLVVLSINFPLWNLHDMLCLLCLLFIIRFIESACPSLLLPKLDPLVFKNF